MKKLIYILLLLFIASCDDIINTESNIEKELIFKQKTSSDSLSVLSTIPIDLGFVKIGGVSSALIAIKNNSDTLDFKIYSIENTNKQGLFEYQYATLPIIVKPSENTALTQNIRVKFIASAFESAIYRDTVILNENPDFYIPIKAEVKFN